MSQQDQGQEQTDTTPAPTAYQTETQDLMEQVYKGYSPRIVKGVRPNMLGQEAAAGFGAAGTRALEISGVSPQGAQFLAERAKGQYWLGPGLMDEEGFIARQEYSDLDTDANTILRNMTKEQRLLWAKEADRIGYYGASDPSPMMGQTGEGFNTTDVTAMKTFLNMANVNGVTFSVLFSKMSQMASAKVKGTVVKVTAPEDIEYYFRQQWLNTYGTMPTKQKIDAAIKGYQQMERQASAQSRLAPSLTTGTRALATDLGRPEARGGNMVGKAMQRAFKILGGGA
jgi:hypothetical protein